MGVPSTKYSTTKNEQEDSVYSKIGNMVNIIFNINAVSTTI